ncbi:DUF4249 domain-containing protein [Ancylomarina sp. 16SWW S1-10-2]|uniref:DUF4249 domain-containing protein n=1 Tax=Ancylomarina sp. 16SWW S1-10-2 TaxID=2499681 RepID=UPI0012AD527E|nr:DUF4249 domain-containing protein [Ancylomarina sp. 16SWW S1-10-2]MRT93023.1 DUF4249 domain-containing protein [Ancylomarina sp. 16SWW S1-10-2]
MKKIYSINKLASLMLIALGLFSCTEEITVKLDNEETRLSVEAKVNSDLKKHLVILKETSDVFYNQEAVPVKNANVLVSDGVSNFTYIEVNDGVYESEIEFAGEAGKTYTLSINNVDVNKDGDMEEYLASSTMQQAYAVDSIKLHFDSDHESDRGRNDDEDEDGEFWLLSIYMQDNPDKEDYYAFASRINNLMVHDTITEVLVQKDTYFNGEKTKGADVSEFNQNKADEILHDSDIVTLETYAINKDYYDFVTQLQEMDEGQNMFSGPPGNIKTNISNGALGFFSVYSITRTSIIHKAE